MWPLVFTTRTNCCAKYTVDWAGLFFADLVGREEKEKKKKKKKNKERKKEKEGEKEERNWHYDFWPYFYDF